MVCGRELPPTPGQRKHRGQEWRSERSTDFLEPMVHADTLGVFLIEMKQWCSFQLASGVFCFKMILWLILEKDCSGESPPRLHHL